MTLCGELVGFAPAGGRRHPVEQLSCGRDVDGHFGARRQRLVVAREPAIAAIPRQAPLHNPATMPLGRLARSGDIDGPLSVFGAPAIFGLAVWRNHLGGGFTPAAPGLLTERALVKLAQPLQFGVVRPDDVAAQRPIFPPSTDP